MTDNKLYSMLGIAKKAGALVLGSDEVCNLIRADANTQKLTPKLILISNDASANTVKRITNCCEYYGIEYIKTDIDSAGIAHATGKGGVISSVGITNIGFAKAILKLTESLINKSTCQHTEVN